MSSFRDRFNPEAVHFPASIRSKVLISCGALVILLCLIPTYWVEQPLLPRAIDTALVFLACVFVLLSWPADLKTDQFGVSAHSPLRYKRGFVGWKDVASVERRLDYGGRLAWLGIKTESLVVYSSDGRRIVHTALHGDRDRFEHELDIHGVAPNHSADRQIEQQ